MHTFQINALIRFLASSTFFEPHGFIIRRLLTHKHAKHTVLHIQTVSPIMKPRGSKHVGDNRK